jgi:hypothetical protein
LGSPHAEASTLAQLGATYHTAGDPAAASAVWQHARDILDDLDQPAADQVRAQLHHLGAKMLPKPSFPRSDVGRRRQKEQAVEATRPYEAG